MKRAWASVFLAFVFLAASFAALAGKGAADDTNKPADPSELARTISDEVARWTRDARLRKPPEAARNEQLRLSAILSRLAGEEGTLAKQLEAVLGGGDALPASTLTEALLNANRGQIDATVLELAQALDQPASLEGLAPRLAAGQGGFKADRPVTASGKASSARDAVARIRAESEHLLELAEQLEKAVT